MRPPSEEEELEARLVNRLGALALRVEEAVAEATEEHGAAAASHPEALTALRNFADGERPEVLQTALGLSQPGLAHLVAKLECGGLVRRAPDPADGRASRLHLTSRGRRLAQRVLEDRRAAVARLLAPLDAAQRGALLGAVDAVLFHDTVSVARARRTCRSCDEAACDHPATCPVTAGADRWR